MTQNKLNIQNSIDMLKAYAISDNNLEYKIILGIVFNKNKMLTKKKAKAEEVLLADLSKDSLIFPHNFGKSPIIALYTLKNLANPLGIDYIGADNMIKDIQNNIFTPNYLLCFKDEMPLLSRHSRILGPKGLMPTPKQGTVVDEDSIVRVIDILKKGSVKLKINKNLITQIPVGTVNMGKDAIYENINHIISFINTKLPVSFLKTNLKNIYVTSTQSPSACIKYV